MAYLKTLICWKTSPATACVHNIIIYMTDVLERNTAFAVVGYGIGFGFSLLILFASALRYAPRPRLLFWSVIFSLELAPFILSFYLGGAQPPRTQMTLPFVIAANFALTLILIPHQNLARFAAFAFAIFIFLTQSNAVLRMQYTDDLRFQNDLFLVYALEQRVALAGGADKPVFFVNAPQPRLNNVSQMWNLIGLSVTEANVQQPTRLHAFAQSMGVRFKYPNDEQKQRAYEEAKTMPIFPADGSVKNIGDFVVVKLGKP